MTNNDIRKAIGAREARIIEAQAKAEQFEKNKLEYITALREFFNDEDVRNALKSIPGSNTITIFYRRFQYNVVVTDGYLTDREKSGPEVRVPIEAELSEWYKVIPYGETYWWDNHTYRDDDSHLWMVYYTPKRHYTTWLPNPEKTISRLEQTIIQLLRW